MSTTLTLRAVTPDEIAALSNAGYSAYRYHFSASGFRNRTECLPVSEYHPQVMEKPL